MFENYISIDARIYPLSIVRRAIYKNQSDASFLIDTEQNNRFKVFFERKTERFEIQCFLDDLNYYNLIEEENKNAEPILNNILNELNLKK